MRYNKHDGLVISYFSFFLICIVCGIFLDIFDIQVMQRMSVARCMFISIVLCIRPCIHTLRLEWLNISKFGYLKKKYSVL